MAGQFYSVGSLGGLTSQPYLSDRVRGLAQPMFKFRQFIDVKEAIGKGRGDTWLFDKTSNVATQGGTLIETNTIPETNFTVVQGTGTITEYGDRKIAMSFRSSWNTLKPLVPIVATV